MKRILTLFLVCLLMLASVPAKAQTPPSKPVIVQIGGAQEVGAASIAAGPNKVYLPLVVSPKCYNLTPLQPGAAANVCASLSDYAGAQSLAGYVATVNNGAPLVFQADMPSRAVSIPEQSITIGPVNQTPVSALRIRISAMAYLTETAVSAAGVNVNNPMPARANWVIKNAMQNSGESNPILFPMSILAPHYSQPVPGSDRTIPAAICGQSVGLYIYGYPINIQFDDATAASGNLWLEMEYPSCPGMKAYPWTRLDNFWRSLKAFPSKYPNIDRDADAGTTTYHATIQVSDAQGRISTVNAIIVVAVVGGIVLIAVFPPSGVGWWLLYGVAAL